MQAADADGEIGFEDYRRLYRQLVVQLGRMGIPEIEIEDLVLETFLHAQQALNRGMFEGRSSRDTWIVSIAKKRALKYHRRLRTAKRRAEHVSLDEPSELFRGAVARLASGNPDPESQAAERQNLSRTTAAIAQLPDDFRAPLVLNVEGHSYKEISALLGISISLVTSRIHQARGKLRQNTSLQAKGLSN